ncbi:ABC transporter permease [Nonomuraea harbinensis]|uniref:ABC transporter permease n=1 Tax=Nonomuraea harbinensis TaxID=1286938 RepID=A0ABW1C415_9ACTN|nr:hypothetical protein [Nonomuraea harbinensis]
MTTPGRWVRPWSFAAGLVVPLAALAAWQVATGAGWFTASQLPPPAAVLAAVGELIRRGELWQHVAISGQRVLLGFAGGASAGLVLGALVGLYAPVRTLLAPSIAALRAVPSLAWVPLLVLWLGIAEGPKIVLVAAELIASSMGLGFLLIDSQNTGRTDILLLSILLLALLGKAADMLLGLAVRAAPFDPR